MAGPRGQAQGAVHPAAMIMAVRVVLSPGGPESSTISRYSRARAERSNHRELASHHLLPGGPSRRRAASAAPVAPAPPPTRRCPSSSSGSATLPAPNHLKEARSRAAMLPCSRPSAASAVTEVTAWRALPSFLTSCTRAATTSAWLGTAGGQISLPSPGATQKLSARPQSPRRQGPACRPRPG